MVLDALLQSADMLREKPWYHQISGAQRLFVLSLVIGVSEARCFPGDVALYS